LDPVTVGVPAAESEKQKITKVVIAHGAMTQVPRSSAQSHLRVDLQEKVVGQKNAIAAFEADIAVLAGRPGRDDQGADRS
jgi:hypothetical protein